MQQPLVAPPRYKAFECTTLRWPTGMATSKLLVVGAGEAKTE